MDITKLFVSGREKAQLNGNLAAYRSHLSNRIHTLRRRLGIATKPRAHFTNKPAVTKFDIHANHEYAHLLTLLAERAWACAMSMREVHATEKQGIKGSTRSHIISRLWKATRYASDLHELLADREKTGSSQNDVLEARAYAASLHGAMAFEKQSWEECINQYAVARILYSVLATATNQDCFRDLLLDPIDPSIRYGAYQLGIPRTTAVLIIARQRFPKAPQLIIELEKLDPNVFNDQATKAYTSNPSNLPTTITWQSRTVVLEDAAIATALASVKIASKKLADILASSTVTEPKEKATAYDGILIASQDAVDATKTAIDELMSEGMSQGDKRMQSLQVTRTAVTYDMVSWRIGRNRVLVGEGDGLVTEQSEVARNAPTKESLGRGLAQLREKNVLYDAILQSLETVKELPGVASNSSLLQELDAKYDYYEALKSLAIARSYALLSKPDRSLALLNLAVAKCHRALQYHSDSEDLPQGTPPNIAISSAQVGTLLEYTQGELQRFHGLVELTRLMNQNSDKEEDHLLVEMLHQYPNKGLRLKQLVSYPPKLDVIPVKPLFLDAAWNYIEYPGREQFAHRPQDNVAKRQSVGETQQQKRGWFTFGR